MSLDPQYVERVLNANCAAPRPVNSRADRASLLKAKPDAVLGFLIGKGLSPQEIMDVVECWWLEGVRFEQAHGSAGSDAKDRLVNVARVAGLAFAALKDSPKTDRVNDALNELARLNVIPMSKIKIKK